MKYAMTVRSKSAEPEARQSAALRAIGIDPRRKANVTTKTLGPNLDCFRIEYKGTSKVVHVAY